MPEMINIDIWGQIEGESDNYRVKPPEVVEMDAPEEGDGAIYKRFFKETPCAFHRDLPITSGGRTIILKEYAYDDWANRESAMYVPIDTQPRSVPRQEIIYSGGTQTVAAVVGSAYSQVLSSATLYYGNENAAYVASSYLDGKAVITSSGTIEGTFTSAGTYNVTAYLTAPLAKPVPVQIVITVTA